MVMALAGQRGVDGDLVEVTFQLADVRAHALGDEERHFLRQVEPLVLRLLAEDGHLRLEVGRLDVGGEAPFEAGAEPLFEGGDLLRRRDRR